MKTQLNEVQRLQKTAGLLTESQIKIYSKDGTEESEVDLSLIDQLAKQIAPISGYGDWEDRIANIDYKAVINKLAKEFMKLGNMQDDRISFEKRDIPAPKKFYSNPDR